MRRLADVPYTDESVRSISSIADFVLCPLLALTIDDSVSSSPLQLL